MELIVNTSVIADAQARMITLDEYAYLFFGIQSVDTELQVNMPKLMRLGYVDKYFALTEKCYELIPDAQLPKVTRFEDFWAAYPVDDQYFNHEKTRSLRLNKPLTRQEYVKQAAVYGEDFIIDCLNREVEDRLSNSSVRNSFKYMKNSMNYLKTKQFLDYA